MVNILEKERLIQKLDNQLIPCNKGNCSKTRHGISHISHYQNKLKIDFSPTYLLFALIFGLTLSGSILIDDPTITSYFNSAWLAITIGILSIWYARQLSEKQTKQDEWSRYMLQASIYYHDKDWELAKESYDKSLEIIPNDFAALNNSGTSLMALRKHTDAILYFKKLLDIDPENTAALSNMAHCYQQISLFDKAIDYFEEAIRIKPDFVNAKNNLAVLYLDQANPSAALNLFEEIIELDPKDHVSWTNKAVSLIDLKEYDEALICCNKALKIEPKHAEAFIQKVRILFSLRQYEEIIHVGNIFLKLKPLHVKQDPGRIDQNKILYYMGVAYAELEKFKDALRCFEEFLVIVPDDVQVLKYKADCLHALGDYKNSLKTYDELLKIDPYHYEVLSNKSGVLQKLNKTTQALLCLNEALRIRPTFSAAHYNKGFFLSEHDNNSDLVSDCHKKVLGNNSLLFDDVKYKARSMFFLEHYDAAIGLLNSLSDERPRNLEILFLKARCHKKLENFDDVIGICDRILEISSKNTHALVEKGLSLGEKGHFEEAILAYNDALQNEPKSIPVLLNKGVALNNLGNPQRAIDTCFDEVIKQESANFKAIYSKGQSLKQLRRFNDALECFNNSIEIDPNDYGSYFEKGTCLIELARFNEAIQCFEKSSELNSSYSLSLANLSIVYGKLDDYSNMWRYWYEYLEKENINHQILDGIINKILNFGVRSLRLRMINDVLLID